MQILNKFTSRRQTLGENNSSSGIQLLAKREKSIKRPIVFYPMTILVFSALRKNNDYNFSFVCFYKAYTDLYCKNKNECIINSVSCLEKKLSLILKHKIVQTIFQLSFHLLIFLGKIKLLGTTIGSFQCKTYKGKFKMQKFKKC